MSKFIPILSRFALPGYTTPEDIAMVADSGLASLTADICNKSARATAPFYIGVCEQLATSNHHYGNDPFIRVTLVDSAGVPVMYVEQIVDDKKKSVYRVESCFYHGLRERGVRNVLQSVKHPYIVNNLLDVAFVRSSEKSQQQLKERRNTAYNYMADAMRPQAMKPSDVSFAPADAMALIQVALGKAESRTLNANLLAQVINIETDYVNKMAKYDEAVATLKERLLDTEWWCISYYGEKHGFGIETVRYPADYMERRGSPTAVVSLRNYRSLDAFAEANKSMYDELMLQLAINKSSFNLFDAVGKSGIAAYLPKGDFVDREGRMAAWWYSITEVFNPHIYIFERV